MSLNSFLTQSDLQFIPYTGPPEPKPKSRRNPLKTPPSNQHDYLFHDKNPSTGPAVSLHRAGDVDLETADKNICKLEDYSSCHDINCAGGLLPPDEQGVEVEHFVSSCFSKEVLREGSSDLYSFGDSSQEDVVVTVGSEPELDATTAKDNLVTQAHDCTHVPGMATCNYRGTDGTDDAISLERLEVPESQANRLPNRNLTSTPPTRSTRSSMMDIGQPTQGASGDTLLEAMTHQSQRSVHEMAEEQDKYAPLLITSSDSDGNRSYGNDDNDDDDNDDDDNDDDDNDNDDSTNRTKLKRKRERSLPAKWCSQKSNGRSKPRPGHATHSAGQRKPSSGSRLLANCPTRLKIPPAAQYSDYDTERCYSDESSDGSSGRRLGSNKRLKSAHRSSKQRRKRDRYSALEDDEYEVEQILEARVYHNKLQYRAKWLGYEVDRKWYPASNFKNSPFKLLEFHRANPIHPGPPKRLDVWVKCFQEDRDADDHSNDDEPQRSDAGRSGMCLSSSPISPCRVY